MKKLRHLKPAGEAVFKDSYTTKARELLEAYSPGMQREIAVVGVPLSKASISHSGASFAPTTIREALQSYTTYSGEEGMEIADRIIDFGDIYMNPTDVTQNQERITEGLTDVFATETAGNWMILGGDHSISYSSIKAFAEKKTVGVIQFDAHHDLRNTEDGGPTNGTPFRRLLEDSIIRGENLTQIGIRDFTNSGAYDEYAKEQSVTVYTMADVDRLSLNQILEIEIQRLAKVVDVIYLSVDMDVLDQAFAPGCPAIGPGGMDSKTLLKGILFASHYEKVQAMDIVEIDPTIDFRNMTSRIAAYVMLQFIKGKRMDDGGGTQKGL
ncbi:formimidoylglutamase [Virgibacillus profundi]|uniref:Formimidoylglutamase n=1 Tax=Virgibacillus profundi TaxID=2024555 RepID=A0A2A2IJK4_9BACI|nr:formimidoylglutamase [Virgibacillus profundi]PAV31444.1 formimidoylglutamase [Virgibacillus profundi]PXY55630.1 formimidoylglutamase [Virgibacillus profundi]